MQNIPTNDTRSRTVPFDRSDTLPKKRHHSRTADKRPAASKESTPADASVLFWSWLVGSTVLFLLPLFGREFWVLIPYVLQLGCGVTVYMLSLPLHKRRNLLIFLGITVVLTALLVVLRLLLPTAFANLSDHVALVLAVLPFAFIGAVLTICSIVETSRKRQRCTVPVRATCVELLEDESYDNESGASTTVYCPVYEYEFSGRLYRCHDKQYSNISVPELYGVYDLLVNPNDPEDFYDPKRAKGSYIVRMVIGGGFLLMGGLGFMMTLMSALNGM